MSATNSKLPKPRVIILANKSKDQVSRALTEFRPWLADRAEIVAEPDLPAMTDRDAQSLPEADLALVLGGDGTMLGQARLLVDMQVPLLGINFGKLGFLAEFSINDVKKHWKTIVTGGCRMTHRMMVRVCLFEPGAKEFGDNGESDDATCTNELLRNMPQPIFDTLAMNDAVVTAGPPYRMIEIELAIEPGLAGTSAATFSGDGVIVATPSGSTAYNLAAGGPIVSPGIDGLVVSAICPQSLAFRPIVFKADCSVWLRIHRANPGTTLMIDGQKSCNIDTDMQVMIAKHEKTLPLIHNPDLNYWKMLASKMHWAARPRRIHEPS